MNPFIIPILLLGGAGLFLLRKGGTPGVRPISSFSRGMVVGDSHSEASWTFGGRMGEFLQSQGVPAHVVGNRGWSVARYLGTPVLDQELARFRPDLLIVALGANDQVGPRQVDDYQNMLRRFLEKAQRAGVQEVIWFGPSKSEGAQAHRMPTRVRVAETQRDFFRSHGVPGLTVRWIDSLALTSDLPTRDGVHMAHREYGIWANRAQQTLI